MFYLLTIFIPILIIIIFYFMMGFSNDFFGHIRILIKVLPYMYLYAFLLYFLEMEDYLHSSWAFSSLMFFLVPISIILIIIYFFIKGRQRVKKDA